MKEMSNISTDICIIVNRNHRRNVKCEVGQFY